MLDKKLENKIIYFNNKVFFTKEDLLKVFTEEELMNLYEYNNNDIISSFITKCAELEIILISSKTVDKAKELLNNPNLSREMFEKSFSFGEKRIMILSGECICKKLIDKVSKDKKWPIFTNEEAVNIICSNNSTYWKIVELAIESLSDDRPLIPFIEKLDKDIRHKLLKAKKYKMSDEFIASFNKIYPIDKYSSYDDEIRKILCYFLTDEQRIYYINYGATLHLKKDYYIVFIYYLVNSFKDPYLKIRFLHKVKGMNSYNIIVDIEEDEVKVKYLTITSSHKEEIIRSIKNDEIKEKLLLKYLAVLSPSAIGGIVASFNDDSYIDKYYYLIKNEKSREAFLFKIRNPEKKFERKDEYIIKTFKALRKKGNIKSYMHFVKKMPVYEEIIKSTNNQAILAYGFSCDDSELDHQIFQKLSFWNKRKEIKDRLANRNIFNYYIYLGNPTTLVYFIQHTEHFPEYDNKFDGIIKIVANYEKVDFERLLKMVRVFGLELLARMQNENVKYLLNTSDDEFAKITNIFSEEIVSFDENNQNDALNSIIQRKFRIFNPNEILIFTETLHAVDDGKSEDVVAILEKIGKVVSYNKYNINPKELYEGLMSKDEKTIALFNKITNEYISTLRNISDYEEKGLAEILYTNSHYEKKSLAKYVFCTIPMEIILQDIEKFKNDPRFDEIGSDTDPRKPIDKKDSSFNEEEDNLINNTELLKGIIAFKKNPKEVSKPKECTKHDIKVVENIIEKLYKRKKFTNIRKTREIKETKKSNLLSILCETNLQQMSDTILNNEEIYKELFEFLNIKKIHCWIGRYKKLAEAADISTYPSVIASFLSNYSEIRKQIFKEETTKISDTLKEFINYMDDTDNQLLELFAKEGKYLSTIIEEISQKCQLSLEQTTDEIFRAAKQLKNSDFEQVFNSINPRIKMQYTKEQIYQVLLKTNAFKWNIAYKNVINPSKISPEEQELIKLITIISKINHLIPEEKDTFILENLFDSTILYSNVDLEEALKNVDSRIIEKVSAEELEKVFQAIYKFVKNTKKQNLVTTTSIIDLADCYDTASKRLRILFGKENFSLIKRNPPPYPSQLTSSKIIAKATKLLIDMHNRDYITVPPSCDLYKLKTGKSIKIIVGDLHNIDNLTYGERTGACMRIGGAGESLFLNSLKNENGFHVTFRDPNNNKLVSRVSGFRNGNTVFLNQLRYSLSEKYNNNDIVEACRLFAKKLIEDSKKSTYPIENVVISKGYAMSKTTDKITNLGVKNIKRGFLGFYSDVDEDAIILASSSPNNSLVPVKLGPNNAEKYKSLRREAIETYGKDAIFLKNQIILLEALYNNKNIEEVEIDETSDIIYAIQGEDWYITLDNEGKAEYYVAKNSKDRDTANKEVLEEMTKLKDRIENYGLKEFKDQINMGGM